MNNNICIKMYCFYGNKFYSILFYSILFYDVMVARSRRMTMRNWAHLRKFKFNVTTPSNQTGSGENEETGGEERDWRPNIPGK